MLFGGYGVDDINKLLDRVQVSGRLCFFSLCAVLAHSCIQRPMEIVLDSPVHAADSIQSLCPFFQTGYIVPRLFLFRSAFLFNRMRVYGNHSLDIEELFKRLDTGYV